MQFSARKMHFFDNQLEKGRNFLKIINFYSHPLYVPQLTLWKMSFFWKVHFIQNLSVTQNTVFQWVKNHLLLSNPKLVFFTRFYLAIVRAFSLCDCENFANGSFAALIVSGSQAGGGGYSNQHNPPQPRVSPTPTSISMTHAGPHCTLGHYL